MWKIIWTKEIWISIWQTLSLLAGLYLLLAGGWMGIIEHDYAQGAFLLILSGYCVGLHERHERLV